jgi:transcriptional regulator with GAF, ATPase, and Fis domain
MDLSKVERSRTGLVQFLIVLIMAFLALIMVVSWNSEHGTLIKGLTILSLLACLHVMTKERGLKKQHDHLLKEVAEKRQQIASMGQELEAGKDEFERLESRLRELTSLYRAISAVNAVADYGQTYDAVLVAAVDLVGGDCGSLMLIDRPRKVLTIASAIGLDQEVLTRADQKVGEGIAGWVALHAEPVLLTGSAADDERFTNLRVREPELRVSISVPLRLQDDVIGVLNLGSTLEADKQTFSDDDFRFVYIFAQHAAVAIERAQLLEEGDRLREMIST